MSNRERLPNRRPSETLSFRHDGQKYHATVGYYSDGRVAEVFLDASKPGSAMQAMARDAAVLASMAIQFGVPIETIRAALTRDDDNGPTGALCKLLDMIETPTTDAGEHA